MPRAQSGAGRSAQGGPRLTYPGYEQGTVGTRLVVLLHAYQMGPASLQSVRAAVAGQYPGADFYVPPMPTGLLSFHDPVAIVRYLLDDMDALIRFRGAAYEAITLIGHSLGALLARKLYVCARGENGDAPLEGVLAGTAARPWVVKVDRIILLAGINRGWAVSHHLSLPRLVGWTVGQWLAGWAMLVTRPPLIMAIHRGAPFIAQLRLQWLSMVRRAAREHAPLPLTVQLLGSIDDLVSPEDNIDLVTGRDFVYLDVPRTGHVNVVDMGDSADGRARRTKFAQALSDAPAVLRRQSLQPGDLQLTPDAAVRNVVFVIHGIRDEGFWTQKIARRVMALWRAADEARDGDEDWECGGEAGGPRRPTYASVTSTYGYFPMLPFLLPARRREKVQWLVDQYTEARARYPEAAFHYVGHSNGTYLLAKALQENPCCQFDRVVFAGSVVRTDYDWASHRQTRPVPGGRTIPQVGPVLNYVATADWVVACFPKAMEQLRLQDLGSGGHDGFGRAAGISQVEYVRGGHGAALREENWADIAAFVARGATPPAVEPHFANSQSVPVRLIGRVSPVVWALLVAVAVGLGWCVVGAVESPFWCGVALAAYVLALYKVLTSV